MKKSLALIMAAGLALSITSVTYANDRPVFLPIDAAMSAPAVKQKLDPNMPVYFGKEHHPRVLKNLGSGFSSLKTNAFAKSDATACNWVFLSNMISLQQQAKEVGANAIINIVSYYKKNEVANLNNFECHVGAMVAGVALKGDFVRIAGK